jgi:mono/diheme cytochrome c family protein
MMSSARVYILGAIIALPMFFGWPEAGLAADPARGRVLYETRCQACHERSVHNRVARKATSFAALREQVLRWSAETAGTWTAEETDDVTLYLNQRYYHFPCPNSLCRADQALLKR